MASQPEPERFNLLPWPQSLDVGSGSIQLRSANLHAAFDELATPRLQRAVTRAGEDLAAKTGLPLDGAPVVLRVRCQQAGDPYPGPEEDESYWLVVDDAGMFLDADTEWGVLRGLTTLVQLVSPQGTVRFSAIDDRPRFAWRGLLLDPARHFLPVDSLRRTLDGMAQCKLNALHLHLSDDQGFRFPVRAFPELASADAYSSEALAGLVEYAADRGIRIIPELDMPGHVTSWLVAYPEWGSQQTAAAERYGVHPACLDPSNESVYEAIDLILTELIAAFPDPFVHIGGDEVSPQWWSEDAAVAALMERESLADVRQVQGYFNRRVGELVARHGRRVMVWDEVLDAPTPEGWTVQAWRGSTARNRALANGNPVLVSAPYYLDLNYPAALHYGFDPAASQSLLVQREDELLTDPRLQHVAEGIRWTHQWRSTRVEQQVDMQLVLGAEACLWGELVTDDTLDVRLWSRLPALAERFWSRADQQDADDLYRRLDAYLTEVHPLRGRDLEAWSERQWARLGVDSRWWPVLRMLEPVKWYARLLGAEALQARIDGEELPQSRPYDVSSALDGLVDHLAPESRAARELARLCWEASEGGAVARQMLEQRIKAWRALADESVAPSDALQELARRLDRLGAMVLGRLHDQPAVAEETLAGIAAPVGELMLAVPADLRRWLLGQ